ncbi:uncharacterized protein GGS25DRAFT_471287 [Hypoxylon fragiforme]|uniref:uncharacterized protein n=1 Tax=Hypoxylon fragiforme TaxID=63214 RepID=UPI0020C6165F|nr:uncharacterized protein GGS25DRAFT_471287 [Hypoxylon fragiforme]KAI2614330.1 hypothetical protein GGS25DRAFT_471287 [Hypoxylon fragiforme]
MSPPLPVPSKALVHALRGIAFGTTCAIGVILEDRRRRISTLRTAITNKEKLKACKRRYHATTDSAVVPSDDALLLGAGEWQWLQTDKATKPYADKAMDEAPPHRENVKSTSSSTRPTTAAQPQVASPPPTHHDTNLLEKLRPPAHFQQAIAQHPQIHTAHRYQRASTAASAASKVPPVVLSEATKKVISILTSKDEERLDKALNRFFEVCRTSYDFKKFDDGWVSLSARLSRECVARNRWEDAVKVLTTTIKAGPMHESLYFAHEPLVIIENIIHSIRLQVRGPEAIAIATQLFLPRLKEKPTVCPAGFELLGKQLISRSIDAILFPQAHHVYWRVFGVTQKPAMVTGWIIEDLYQAGDYKNVIKYYLLNFSKAKVKNKCFKRTVGYVVDAVEGMEGMKADLILLTFYDQDPKYLRSQWIMRLLRAYWNSTEDFSKVKALFDKVFDLGLISKVAHPQGVFRTMVEISVRAGEDDMTKSYYEATIKAFPNMKTDTGIHGFLALSLAKAGDWGGVFDVFAIMQTFRNYEGWEYEGAFVMVLKVFADGHPVSEVRDFVSKYMSDLGVRMHRYMISILANKYGDCHDMPGFMSWLAHCDKSGFALEPGLLNSVLYNCWTQWRLSYPELQVFYNKIGQLDPNLIDDVTRRIMSQAALASGPAYRDSKYHRAIGSRVVEVNKLAYLGRTTSRRDVYEAMNQEINMGKPATAIFIYKRALKFGMSSCQHCLRLAVTAALMNPNNGAASAMALIHKAHLKGDDVGSAASKFIMFQLDQVRAKADEILIHMRNLVHQFEALKIIVDGSVMTRMAMICTKLNQHERAILLCKLAMDRNGSTHMCYSRLSIRALLMAYAHLLDVEGIKQLLDDLFNKSNYTEDKSVLWYLRSMKRIVSNFKPCAEVAAILETLGLAIWEVVARRQKARKEGKMITTETLRIMQAAVTDMQGKGTAPATSQDKPPTPKDEEDENEDWDFEEDWLDKDEYPGFTAD